MVSVHEKFMQRAIALAERGRGNTSPNPLVGCVIVKNGRIVGEGWHQMAGGPHAEVYALKEAKGRSQGATLYTTLEPCSHWGKTPPCTQAILKAGISRVVIGLEDPNWRIHGIEELRSHGVEVTTGVLEKDVLHQNEVFVKHISTGMPFVVLKLASSSDGYLAQSSKKRRYLTSKESLKEVHRMRAQMDAVMVGIGTVLSDNPKLTVRLVKGREPQKIVVDSTLRIPSRCALLKDSGRLIVLTTKAAPKEKMRALEKRGVRVVVCRSIDGRVDLKDAMKKIGLMRITSVLLEGGAKVAHDALLQKAVDKIAIYTAPTVLSEGIPITSIVKSKHLKAPTMRYIGKDIVLEGYT